MVTNPRSGRNWNTVARLTYFNDLARKHGFSSWKAQYDDYAAKMVAFRAQCRIEVIDL